MAGATATRKPLDEAYWTRELARAFAARHRSAHVRWWARLCARRLRERRALPRKDS